MCAVSISGAFCRLKCVLLAAAPMPEQEACLGAWGRVALLHVLLCLDNKHTK